MHMCPSCGVSFGKFQALNFGNVSIDDIGDLYYEGVKPHLTANIRLAVEALIRSQGRIVGGDALANIVNEDITYNGIAVMMCRAREAFKAIDPNFDQIESVRKLGYRWRFQGLMQAAA